MDDLSAWAEIINNARPRWQRDALCREYPDVSWFPERGGNGREAPPSTTSTASGAAPTTSNAGTFGAPPRDR